MTTVNDDTAADTWQVPRLSIFHLMLWTFCSAVYLAVYRALESDVDISALYTVLQNTSTVVDGILTGAVLAGSFVLVHARYR